MYHSLSVFLLSVIDQLGYRLLDKYCYNLFVRCRLFVGQGTSNVFDCSIKRLRLSWLEADRRNDIRVHGVLDIN